MKSLVTAIVLLLEINTLSAQTDKFFAFDAAWKGAALERSVYLVRVRKLAEKQFLLSTYNTYGPRISQEIFLDEKAETRNGYCRYYHRNGYQDSIGTCVNNYPDADWFYYDSSGYLIRKKTYQNGVLLKDSVIVPVKKDPTIKIELKPGEEESSFRGGPNAWLRFMNANFSYPARAQQAGKQGTVVLDFMVDQNGKVQDADISKSVEYSMDEEAIRIINKSPAWTPAKKDGVAVKSYKRQPITFRL